MIAVCAHGFTDVGRRFRRNEDGFGIWTSDGLFAVCDGMGGCHGGDVATKVALTAVHEAFCAEPPPGGYRTSAGRRGFERLGAAVRLANRRVVEKSKSSNYYTGIGAAIAAISVEGEAVFIAHVGDCRVYRYRAPQLELLTRDHCLENEIRKYKPNVTDEEIAALPKNVVVRALGLRDEVEVDLHHERAHHGDLYLLCTDGIHGMLDDDAITGIVRARIDLADIANALLDAALEAGGLDDTAAVLVRISIE